MNNFVLKIAFTSSDFAAAEILSRIADTYNGIVDVEWEPEGIVLVPGETLSEDDIQADIDFDNSLVEWENAGFDTKTALKSD